MQLSEKDLNELRRRGLLANDELAFKEGPVVIAENVLTKQRRIVNVTGLLLESDKVILHD